MPIPSAAFLGTPQRLHHHPGHLDPPSLQQQPCPHDTGFFFKALTCFLQDLDAATEGQQKPGRPPYKPLQHAKYHSQPAYLAGLSVCTENWLSIVYVTPPRATFPPFSPPHNIQQLLHNPSTGRSTSLWYTNHHPGWPPTSHTHHHHHHLATCVPPTTAPPAPLLPGPT